MIKVIQGKKILGQDVDWLREAMVNFDRVIVDLGCGDGKWTYRFAEGSPGSLVIGIDAAAASLEKVSHKASRKSAKGGLPNLVYIHAFAEDLPEELTQIANQIYINFPWGSLLGGVMNCDNKMLGSISSLAKPGCQLQLCTSYHLLYEPQMIVELQLPELHKDLRTTLETGWNQHGWQMQTWQQLDPKDPEGADHVPQTSWWKQISAERDRSVWNLVLTC